MAGLKNISLTRRIIMFILTSGLAPVSILAETATNLSEQFPDPIVNFYSMSLEYEMPVKNSEVNDSLSWDDIMNNTENVGSSNVPIPEDLHQCLGIQNIQCDSSDPYRTINGSCNNLFHPTWGIANECYIRYQPASYEGYQGFRNSKNGDPLPPARDITVNIFKDVHSPSPSVSFMFTIFGQTVAHDLSRADNKNLYIPCCDPEFANHYSCIVIPIRSNDPFYSSSNVTCINLHRTESCTYNTICNATNREQVNAVTAALDASMVYGPDDKRAMEIRARDGTGKLNVSSSEYGELLPTDTKTNDVFCANKNTSTCFFSGDLRVNQHVFLTSMTTYYVREHNRIVTKLKKINPHWEGEKLYQEARRINTASIQCITYKEYLPPLLGPYIMEQFNLTVSNTTEGSKYNPNIRLGVSNEFANAAFRLHSMIPKKFGSEDFRFKDLYSNPEIIRAGEMERLMQGVCKTPSEKYDNYYVTDVTQYMAQHPGEPYGLDLSSIDIMRGRDHGVAPYVVMVRFCSGGAVNISTFDDLSPLLMSKKKANMLKENYAAVEDIDLYVGLQMEKISPGSEVGPTTVCIIAKQFYTAKFGDRFFWEHEGEVPSFTADQRTSLKQCSLSRLLCDNAEKTHVQKNVMLLPSTKNPEVPCEEIPEIDLSPWKESPPE